jgi:hypothetical protein
MARCNSSVVISRFSLDRGAFRQSEGFSVLRGQEEVATEYVFSFGLEK